MKAVKMAKIYARPRQRLEQVVPLEAPFSVQLDVCSACNMKCSFCFHSDLEAIEREHVRFGMMDYALFTKIIDDMRAGWGRAKVKKLRLFKVGEPLLNPNLCKMVEYAKKSEVAECIEITTNGTLLDKEMSYGLIKAGVDILNISVNGINERQYENTCQYKMDFQRFRDNIAFFYENRKDCKLYIKYSDIGYSKDEKDSFYQLFGDICDSIFVENILSDLWQETKAGKEVVNTGSSMYGEKMKDKNVCPFLFTTMVINDKGVVHLCCVDWMSRYILGDLKKENICDIWNGGGVREYQKMHLSNKKNSIEICKNCVSLSGSTIDDIDDYAEIILERIEKRELNK